MSSLFYPSPGPQRTLPAPLPAGRKRLIYSGRLAAAKRVDLLIDAFAADGNHSLGRAIEAADDALMAAGHGITDLLKVPTARDTATDADLTAGVGPLWQKIAIDNLMKLADEMGFKVIIDWVANHTGADHIWIAEHPEFYHHNGQGEFFDKNGWDDVYVGNDFHENDYYYINNGNGTFTDVTESAGVGLGDRVCVGAFSDRRLGRADVVGALPAALAPEGVEILGRVDEQEKLERMARAHVHVATSSREGWGLVVSEAAALGTPTIAVAGSAAAFARASMLVSSSS